MATIQDFKNLELRIAKIIAAEDHPHADKLYVLRVEIGDETRQLVAGITGSYAKEDLIGKHIVVIANLEPAVIRGQESQGMLLAAQDESGIVLLMPERPMPTGSVVR